jgi:biopolymer transport protein ExbD
MDLGSRNKIKIEGGMASMTDLVFLLLIFFIIMSLMSNNQTPIDLPKPSDNIPVDQNPVQVTVIITEENKYFVYPAENESQAREFDEIKEQVMEQVTSSGKNKLKIAGHKKADYEAVFKVLALSQANNWEPVLAYNK